MKILKSVNCLNAAVRDAFYLLLVAASIFLVAPVTAGEAGDVDAAMLVEYCGMTEEDPDSHTAMAFCYGYIDAALDYHHAILPSGKRITCPPGTITRQDVALQVVEWAEVNPDKVGEQSPVHVVIEAASDEWPCEEE